MSAYLVNRDGQELGSFELSQIKAGLQTGQFEDSDFGWQDGMAEWQTLSTLVNSAAPAQATLADNPSKTAGAFQSVCQPRRRPGQDGRQPDHFRLGSS